MDCPEEKVQLIAKEEKEPKKKEKKKKKKRCQECNCKLSLIVYTCKCGHIFCHKHLNPHSHNCQFNYKQNGKNMLEKKLERVVNAKVSFI